MPFDPEQRLPGPPRPWRSSEVPAWRDGPPYAMTEMIAAEPALAERLAHRLATDGAAAALADAIRRAAAEGGSILTTGCGTSEHAAMVAACLLADALRARGEPAERVASVQAFELAGRPTRDGVLVAISHEGGTWATNLALAAARAAGAWTALVTVGTGSPAADLGDVVLATGEQDQSWCHTVGYLSPLVAAAAVAAAIRDETLDPGALRALLPVAGHEPATEHMAAALAGTSRLLVVGSGVDHATARELALKVEEGARLPATAHQLETIRHGHLAAADEHTGLVLVLADGEARGGVLLERAVSTLRAVRALGMPAAALLAADLDVEVPPELTPAGRAAVPIHPQLPRMVSAAIGASVPLQLLAERLARARGVNPDTLAREDPRQAAGADA
jgi:glucosamine 6-phosphate synthetase-like amidotransferase/phosphosugar isomerase protein